MGISLGSTRGRPGVVRWGAERHVQALVLGCRVDRVSSLSGLRPAYQFMTGQSLARSSFHGCFTAPLAELMRRLTVNALAAAAAAKRHMLRDAFKPFIEVLRVDDATGPASERDL